MPQLSRLRPAYSDEICLNLHQRYKVIKGEVSLLLRYRVRGDKFIAADSNAP
jgi:hypothetical protein